MKYDEITNENIFTFDYAREERLRFIASIPRGEDEEHREMASKAPARDPRSRGTGHLPFKAHLAGLIRWLCLSRAWHSRMQA